MYKVLPRRFISSRSEFTCTLRFSMGGCGDCDKGGGGGGVGRGGVDVLFRTLPNRLSFSIFAMYIFLSFSLLDFSEVKSRCKSRHLRASSRIFTSRFDANPESRLFDC